MINYMKGSVYKSDSAVLLEKYANRNQSERFESNDQAALNLASIMGTLGCTKATDILAKNPGNRSQS
jgi:hypothetical protein